MGLFSKPPRKSAASGGTPLTVKQRALLEEEQRVKAEMERCSKFVENAPKRAAEIQREQRDELLRRAATTHKGPRPTALVDRRGLLEVNVVVPAQRRMRAERRQGRLMFFLLLLTLAGAILYLYYTVTRG